MEKMHIELDGTTVVAIPVPLPATAAIPSDEYIARRKAAAAGLPILEVPVPEWDDKQGHEEA